jgi:hypothetical protein
MEVTLSGMLTCTNLLQETKALSPMEVKLFDSLIEVNSPHQAKTPLPIVSTLSGI